MERRNAYQQSLAIAKRLAEQDKSNPGWQADHSTNKSKPGDVENRLGYYVGELGK